MNHAMQKVGNFFNLLVNPEATEGFKHKTIKDTSMWDVEVLTEAKSSLETLGLSRIERGSIEYTKKDDKIGYAVGTVQFDVFGVRLQFPFIIEDFKLRPIDIFLHEKKFYPLTSTQIGMALRGDGRMGRPATKEEAKRQTAPLYNAVYPPNYGKYLFADAEFNLSDFAEKHGHGEQYKLYKAATDDKSMTAECAISEIYPNIVPLKDVVSKEAVTEKAGQVKAASFLVTRDGIGFKMIGLCPGGEPIVANIDESNLRNALSQKLSDPDVASSRLLRHGCYAMTEKGGEPAMYCEDIKTVKRSILGPIKDINSSIISTLIDGKYQRGVLIGKHIGAHGQITGNRVFVNKDNYCVQPEIFGRVVSSPVALSRTSGQTPHEGTLCFIIYEKKVEDPVLRETTKSELCAFGPFQILAVSKPGLKMIPVKLTVADEYGAIRKISLVNGLQKFVFTDDEIMVPSEVKFQCTKKRGVAPMADHDTQYKLAMAFEYPTLKVSSYDGHAFSFMGKAADSFRKYIKGTPIEKVAFNNPWNYNYYESLAALRAMGLEKSAAQEILSKAAGGETVTIHNAKDVTCFEKVAQSIPTPAINHKAIIKAAAVVSRALIKQNEENQDPEVQKIAQLDRRATVDRVLSLGLINEKNVAVFVDGIDELEGIITYLASLLVASRIGLSVNEEQVRDALFSVSSITDQLRTIQTASQMASQ